MTMSGVSTVNVFSNILTNCIGDGIYITGSSDIVNIYSNTFSLIGALVDYIGSDGQCIGGWFVTNLSIYNNDITHAAFGNVMEISNTIVSELLQENIKIYNNNITNNGLSGVFNLFYGDFDVYNNVIIMTGAGDAATSLYTGAAVTKGTQVYFYNNTIIDPGYAISIYSNSATPYNDCDFVLKNNIIYGIRTRNINRHVANSDYLYPYITMDYNLYTNNVGTEFDWMGTAYNFADWKVASSQGANSVIGDPLFTTEFTDLTLQAGSPAIGAGIGVGILTDYADELWKDTPSVGAYEYDSGSGAGYPIITSTVSYTYSILVIATGTDIDDGGGTVSTKGICWDTSVNPTTASNIVPAGSGTANFSATIHGLSSNTTYHVRSYITNETGTSYGADIEVLTTKYTPNTLGGKYIFHDGKLVIIK